ncbi:protein of unknown function [Bradyrhizobium vignae]|uniref:Uncharacterized protein n=1 Tax=Bradyrhizobium vignae TaxID=1549949 RepID=A0A2U3Q9S7_9BRAD|nr:protein of unknown function [Bradyrhizobium vignae]
MSCRTGWLTRRSAWPRSARPKAKLEAKATAEEELQRRAEVKKKRIAEGGKRTARRPHRRKRSPG